MALPSLKDVGISVAKAVLPKSIEQQIGITPREKPMTFEVGVGLTPEKKAIAETKVKQVAEVGKKLPESLDVKMSQEDAWNINARLMVKQKKGGQLTELEKAAGQEAGNVIEENMIQMVVGFMSPFGFISKFVPKSQIASKLPEMKEVKSSVQKIIQALKEVKPIRAEQETLYTKARGEKIAEALSVGKRTVGEAGFFAEKGALKGELPKVQFEPIREKIGQADIDDLFNTVKDNPLLDVWEKITAREGLSKMLGKFGGKVPTEGEISLLDKVFGEEFTETILSKRPLKEKILEGLGQLANIPRSVMSSFDMSFGGRQGSFLAPSFRKQFFKSWTNQFEWFGSEKAYNLAQEEIAKNQYFQLAKESKLVFTGTGRIMGGREERFMSQWAEKIPIIGKGIEASGRAYTGFANKLRMDVFSSMIENAQKLGLNPIKNRDLAKSIANFVNNATGRGSLGEMERAATGLNAFFFSPRLMASRLTLLNPIYYITQPSIVRKQALKSLFGFAGTGMTILGLSKLAGAEIGTDPRSADFGKIKIGNMRVDIWGGFQQYIRMASQLLTGKYVSSITRKEITLGEGYKPLTRYDILFRLIETKEAPIFSFITDLLKGQTFMGEKVEMKKEIAQRFIPMAIQDVIDVAKDDPKLIPIGALGIFGVGVQTYEPVIFKAKGKGMFPSLKTKGMKMPSLKDVGSLK